MDDGHHGQQMYGAAGATPRSSSSTSSSPPISGGGPGPGGMLVVPQPINASAKMPSPATPAPSTPHTPQHNHSSQVNGRKYQCKMCPTVSHLNFYYNLIFLFQNYFFIKSGVNLEKGGGGGLQHPSNFFEITWSIYMNFIFSFFLMPIIYSWFSPSCNFSLNLRLILKLL